MDPIGLAHGVEGTATAMHPTPAWRLSVETIARLSRAIEHRDDETGGHVERMSAYSALLADRAGIEPESIRLTSILHDVGKIAVPERLLLKPGELTPRERAEMERHAAVGREILAGSGSELLELAASIAWTHHERWDGLGYPRGIEGTEIPLEGRIAAIADVFDALTSDRVYRPAFSLEQTVEMMGRWRGTHFDPELLDEFLESLGDVLDIRARFPQSPPSLSPEPPAPAAAGTPLGTAAGAPLGTAAGVRA